MKRRYAIISAVLFIDLLVGSLARGMAQPTSLPVTVEISSPRSMTQDVSDSFTGQLPLSLPLRFQVGRGGWRFIRFDFSSPDIELIGDPSTGQEEGEILPGRWYAFRRSFTLTLMIEATAISPVSVQYLIGRLPDGGRQPATAEQALQLAAERRVAVQGEEHYVKFFWETDRHLITVEPSRLHFLTSEGTYPEPQKLSIRGDPIGWTFIRFRNIPEGLRIWAPKTSAEIATLEPDQDVAREQWLGFKKILTLQVAFREAAKKAGHVNMVIESGEATLAGDTSQVARAAIEAGRVRAHGRPWVTPIWWEPSSLTAIARMFIRDVLGSSLGRAVFIGLIVFMGIMFARFAGRYVRRRRLSRQSERAQEVPLGEGSQRSGRSGPRRWRWWRRWRAALWPGRAEKTALVDAPGEDFSLLQRAASESAHSDLDLTRTIQIHTKELLKIEQKLVALEDVALNVYKINDRLDELEQKLQSQPQPPSVRELQEDLALSLDRLNRDLQADLEKSIQSLRARMDQLERALAQQTDELERQREQSQRDHQQLQDVAERLRQWALADRSSSAASRSTSPSPATEDRLYARLLGLIFAGHMEGSGKQAIDATIERAGETLNRFFQEELPPSSELDDVAERVAAIITALETLVRELPLEQEVQPDELRRAIERARRLHREIIHIRDQLENRQLELDLHIQVSASPTGRMIFLEELGRVVKEAIDKFADPRAYIEQRLDRLVTEELIAAVDFCDHQVAPPGQDDDLERRLKELFQAAGVKAIVPIPMEPFQPEEHNIVELVAGGRSQAIARVIRRGFLYNQRILRKADVAVYK
ncbi:MAG: nucleotide exchange factor GrpE [Acidobacteria bacterium]|nr:MAG: nucleotide exchange factor GrpE [Acidobacteriota bacterium]